MTRTHPITEYFLQSQVFFIQNVHNEFAISSVYTSVNENNNDLVSITQIWNRVMNFGNGSGYSVPATNH